MVDVVVTDKTGKPIPGLSRENFVVEENGKTQKIATFVKPEETATGGPAVLPPGIYSNRPQYRSAGGPITVLLLDALNTPFQDQAYARHQMLRFVQEQYKPGQRMAVFTLTGSLNVLQDFTSDPQILYVALQRYRPQPQEFINDTRATTSITSSPSTSTSVAAVDASTPPVTANNADLGGTAAANVAAAQAAIQSFENVQTSYAEDQRAVITVGALKALGGILGGLPGRKSIIWVTGNLPFSLIPEDRTVTNAELEENLPSLNTRRVGEHAAGNYAATFRQAHAEDIREVAAELSNAQVAIYPVDARGLAISTSVDSQESMREMARDTGGRTYVNQNEIREGVARAFADESATYTLGYYPENKKWDGKYRQIKVKVTQQSAEIQHRRGYYAIDPTQVKGYSREQEVASALNTGLTSTLVSFTARVLPPADNKSAKGKIGVDFLVDAGTLTAEDVQGGKKMNVAFYATIYTSGGKMLGNRSMKVDQVFNADTYKQLSDHGMLLHLDLDPSPGSNQIRLAVQDNRTGLVGTIDAPAPVQ
ncbi:MAG: hypothetical protein NVS1B11_13590 [Terriglobales bacterium]